MRPSHGNRTGVVERALEAVHGKNVPIGAGTDAGEGAALIDLHRAVDDEIAVDGVGTTYIVGAVPDDAVALGLAGYGGEVIEDIVLGLYVAANGEAEGCPGRRRDRGTGAAIADAER